MNWLNLDGDYYVSKTYGSDGNTGTYLSPFKTIKKGFITIGQTLKQDGSPKKLIVEGGHIYSEDLYSNITRYAIDLIFDGEYGILSSTMLAYKHINNDIVRNAIFEGLQIRSQTSGIEGIFYYNCKFLACAFYDDTPYPKFNFFNCILKNSTNSYSIYIIGKNNLFINCLFSNTNVVWYNVSSSYFNTVLTGQINVTSGFIYNAFPEAWLVASGNNININSIDDCHFVDYNSNNYNLLNTSPLINAGIPDYLTGKPSNIGPSFVVDSFNANSIAFKVEGGAVLTNIEVDVDNSFILLPGYREGSIESGLIDLGNRKLITKIDINKVISFFTNGKPQQYIDTYKSYTTGIAVTGTNNTITIDSLKSSNINSYYNGMIIKLITGQGSSFIITGDTLISNNIISNISNITDLYLGQVITGTGIPINTTITSIGTTSITISNNATATNTGVSLTLYEPIRNITGYVGGTNIVTVNSNWNINPNNTTTYEIYETQKMRYDFEIKWTDNASDIDTKPWSKMQTNSIMNFSDSVNRYGNADDNYNSSLKDYIRARYYKLKFTLRDIS